MFLFSLVDGLTGNFLEKTNPSRRVTSYYEGVNKVIIIWK